MVRTSSLMIPLGSPLPNFALDLVPPVNEEISNANKSLLKKIYNNSLSERPLLIMIICSHCPFVKHIEAGISSLAKDYQSQIEILAISSNSLITHPQDGPDYLAKQAALNNWNFPYLLDSDQNFAKALKAACTPDFFVFSSGETNQKKLLYRGQMDDSRPGNNIPVSGKDLREALDAAMSGEKIIEDQRPSIGCNIKWHPGEEPYWFG